MNILTQSAPGARCHQPPTRDVVSAVNGILSVRDAELDYARAKVALDALVDPEADTDWTFAELDRLTDAARGLAGADPSESDKLRAVRTIIYEAGAWNGFRAFAYDLSDPDGLHLPNALLHNYLRTGLGQCVSMPILFLIVGERLGLNVTLARAPNHFFIRYTAPDGRVLNLETTSGGHPARLEWFRQEMPMSDLALASGLYMRSLPRREAVAMMAEVVLAPLRAARHWREVGALSDLILQFAPRSVLLVTAGSIYGLMLKREFQDVYPIPFLIPEHLRARRLMLMERNNSLISAAEALGWEASEEDIWREEETHAC